MSAHQLKKCQTGEEAHLAGIQRLSRGGVRFIGNQSAQAEHFPWLHRPQGQQKSFSFSNLGVAPLFCNVHPELSGYIVIVPTPYFAVTDKEGNIAIKDVPDGSYTLKTWSEVGKPGSQSVSVSGGSASVDITVTR